jgi:DNA-binding response OmpR family regulator
MLKTENVTILVVDDEQDLRDIIEDRFRSHGFKVLTAPSGNTAWDLLQKESVQIVVTDIRMPDGTGIHLLKNIRARDFDKPRTFVISGFSGFSLDEVYELGADGLFAKPFDTKVLIETIRQSFLPRSARWQVIPIDPADGVIDRDFESVQRASDAHQCSLGRGGFFLAIDKDGLIEEGNIVNFSLQFTQDSISL